MNALKTVVIEYLGGGVSSQKYNSDSINKSEYLSHLASFTTDEESANVQWKLSNEIYIPEGETLVIPANVTLVADGGFFSGPGTIKANQTKIKASFEQIFSPELNIDETSIWDVKISHPEWFGVTTVNKYWNSGVHLDEGEKDKLLNHDDSGAIQKAINLISASTLYLDQGSDDGVYDGGRVVCKPYSLYSIKKTIYLPLGISFDGGLSNFFYGCDPATYMFKINMLRDQNEWEISERGQMDTIANIRMLNPKKIGNALGIYSASQNCVFENISSEYFVQTFKRHGKYIDSVTLKNISVAWSKSYKSLNQSDLADYAYQIDLTYIGDNLFVDNISISRDSEDPDANLNLLKVNACGGGVIQRVLNGNIYITSSNALTLSGVHQEFGNTVIENSQFEINGLCHFKSPGVPAVIIKKVGEYEQRSSSIRNTTILYDGKRYPSFSDELDIQLPARSAAVKIENVLRGPKRGHIEASSLYGIRVNNSAFTKNSAKNSISSFVNGSSDTSGETANPDSIRGVMLNNQISYCIGKYEKIFDGGSLVDDIGNKYFTSGTYYYHACIVLDKERNIGYNPADNEQIVLNVATGQSVSDVYLRFQRHYYLGLTIRLFRKKREENKLFYLDVPVCTSHNIFVDFGARSEYGENWKEVNPILILGTSDIMDANNNLAFSRIIPPNLLPQECNSYQSLGENVIVKMPQAPDLTKSTWVKGDMVYISSESRQIII